jgi:hypothetical protein
MQEHSKNQGKESKCKETRKSPSDVPSSQMYAQHLVWMPTLMAIMIYHLKLIVWSVAQKTKTPETWGNLPKKTAKWTLSRKSRALMIKWCEVATKMNVCLLKNRNQYKKLQCKPKFTPGFASFCKSAKWSNDNESNGPCRMGSCCTQTMFTVGCVKRKILASSTLTVLTWSTKPSLIKPCVQF